MSFSPATLLMHVREHLPAGSSGDICVAFSGGLDSTVLLRALADAVRAVPELRLRAVHVDHQLHAQSAQWERHCAQAALGMGVPYLSCKVIVDVHSDGGVESAARDARYGALRDLLRPGEVLLTAHHADDQLETLLLALARSSGWHGLAAMPVCQPFGQGWQLRPLLDYPRADLETWGRGAGLTWIDDPANDNRNFSRNLLRHDIIPLLRQRWPAIALSATRSAGHMAEGASLLDELARIDLTAAASGPCLQVEAIAALSGARRRNLLRYWVRLHGARPPSTRKLRALEHDMLAAQHDRLPIVEWDGFEVRRHRGLLYAVRDAVLRNTHDACESWDWRHPLQLPAGLGSLRTENVPRRGLDRSRLPSRVTVDFRHGGEVMQPTGQDHHRKLKKLLQEQDILPWWRNHVPLIWADDALVAVADLWVADEFAADKNEEGLAIVWEARPEIRAVAR